jgi:hypothetical protein
VYRVMQCGRSNCARSPVQPYRNTPGLELCACTSMHASNRSSAAWNNAANSYLYAHSNSHKEIDTTSPPQNAGAA